MYESNGQDVKIRGTASHIAEKYLQLARDAQSSGDTIASENYYQHAEHYFRMIAAAQEQFRQSQPFYQPQPGDQRNNAGDDGYDDGDSEQPQAGEPFAPRDPQSFYPQQQNQPQQQHHQQYQQHQPQHQQHQPHHQQHQPQPQAQPQHFQPRPQQTQPASDEDVERLPSFITGGGGQPPQQQAPQNGQGNNGPGGPNANGPNGYDNQGGDRYPLHRRRRRHRGPRDHSMQGEGEGPTPSGPRPAED